MGSTGLLRTTEIVGFVVALGFIAIGIKFLLALTPTLDLIRIMFYLAEASFLIIVGLATAILCIKADMQAAAYFGFLVHLTGRGLFFILMGFYLFPTLCGGGSAATKQCLNSGSAWVLLGTVVAIVSVVLGFIVLVLRCTSVAVTSGYPQTAGSWRRGDFVDIAAAVVSAGIILLGVLTTSHIGRANPLDVCFILSRAIFLLVLGLASLVVNIRASPTVARFFGFLEPRLGRGIFYILIGCYMCARLYHSPDSRGWLAVVFACSCLSLLVGVVMLLRRHH